MLSLDIIWHAFNFFPWEGVGDPGFYCLRRLTAVRIVGGENGPLWEQRTNTMAVVMMMDPSFRGLLINWISRRADFAPNDVLLFFLAACVGAMFVFSPFSFSPFADCSSWNEYSACSSDGYNTLAYGIDIYE